MSEASDSARDNVVRVSRIVAGGGREGRIMRRSNRSASQIHLLSRMRGRARPGSGRRQPLRQTSARYYAASAAHGETWRGSAPRFVPRLPKAWFWDKQPSAAVLG
jgi:hypothetical protein